MSRPLASRKKAHALSSALFLLGLAALIISGGWWPGIMLAIGLPLGLRQFLMGRTYDMVVTLVVFCGTFATVQYDISWKVFLPILFTLGAIYIVLREFFDIKVETEAEREDDLNHELEEKKK